MPESALGLLLRHLREERDLSLRELATLADVDHAYIYRLETGAKELPSADVLAKLIRPLRAGKRESEMLKYLAEHTETPPDLVLATLAKPAVSFQVFAAAAGASFRGKPQDYDRLLERIGRILAEDDDG